MSERNTLMRASAGLLCIAAAAALVEAGNIVCVNAAGFAVAGSASATLLAVGRAEETVDNSGGSAGDLSVRVQKGTFFLANSAGADEITIADMFKLCYLVDGATVARTDGYRTRSVAGRIEGVEENGVWVAIGEGAVATARKVYLNLPTVSLKNADGGVTRLRSPVAGRITKFGGVNGTAVTGADATAQLKIGGVNVTDALLTWPLSGAAIGQAKAATPSAANVVAEGDVISAAIGGGGTQTGNADLAVEITLS